MKTLLVVAGLFFCVFAASMAYFSMSDPGHEYDLKFVLPIDARQMPQPVSPPAVVSSPEDGQTGMTPVSDGRAEAGTAPLIPERAPVQFGDKPGAASEAPTGR